jgi:imidazoleglycerol phosphate dehydratase HisB
MNKLRMVRTQKGSWVGRLGQVKIILQPHIAEARGVVDIAGRSPLVHAFNPRDGKEKMLRFTVQGFTHLFQSYPDFKTIYELVFRTEDGVVWHDLTKEE